LTRFPTDPACLSDLGCYQNNLADVLREQNQLEEARQLLESAIAHQQSARKLNPRHRGYRQYLHIHHRQLALTLLQLGEYAEAAAKAEELPRLCPDGWREYARAASVLARCVRLAAEDTTLAAGERDERARAFGDKAVAYLRQAVAQGFKDA